jgi:dTDP-4-dehydrorhamnose 3,5-epimerase-like enzyme
MAHIINLKTHIDDRGSLCVLEDKQIPFKIKRIFHIYNTKENITRGEHRHKKTIQALICLNGSCKVYNNDNNKEEEFLLDSPDKCLILEPKDWHKMYDFKNNCILQVLASKYFDLKDYIFKPY